jgi:hypothetical protein
MGEIVVAAGDVAVVIDDVPHVLICGVTMAHSSHPIVTEYPSLWKPLDVTYDVDEPAPPAPGRAAAKGPKGD